MRFRNDAMIILSIICLQLPFELSFAHVYEVLRSDVAKFCLTAVYLFTIQYFNRIGGKISVKLVKYASNKNIERRADTFGLQGSYHKLNILNICPGLLQQRRSQFPSKFTDKDLVPKMPLLAEEKSVVSSKRRSPSPPNRRSISTDRGAHARSRIKPETVENPPVMKLTFPARVPVTINKSGTNMPAIVSSDKMRGYHGLQESSRQENISDVLFSLKRINNRKIPEHEEEQFRQQLRLMATGTAPFSLSGATHVKACEAWSRKSSLFVKTPIMVIQRKSNTHGTNATKLSICAYNDQRGGSGGEFFAGFILGGAIVGTLGYILAPKIRRRTWFPENKRFTVLL